AVRTVAVGKPLERALAHLRVLDGRAERPEALAQLLGDALRLARREERGADECRLDECARLHRAQCLAAAVDEGEPGRVALTALAQPERRLDARVRRALDHAAHLAGS